MVKYSTLDEPSTPGQVRAITRLCIALKIREPLEERVSNKREARNLIYELRERLKGKTS